eukprot:2199988-Amphidinium_carterae.1
MKPDPDDVEQFIEFRQVIRVDKDIGVSSTTCNQKCFHIPRLQGESAENVYDPLPQSIPCYNLQEFKEHR